MSFIKELKRRNVFKVGVAYLITAWLLLQLTDVLTDLLGLSATIGNYVVVVLLIGFPLGKKPGQASILECGVMKICDHFTNRQKVFYFCATL